MTNKLRIAAVLFATIFCASLAAQPVETLTPLNSEGSHPLLLTIPGYQLTYLPSGSATTQFSFVRTDQWSSTPSASLSGLSIPLLANITGSGSHQSINVATTVGFTVGSFFLIDPGLSTQEVIEVVTVVDSTHFTTTARQNHTAGTSFLRPVYTAFSKFLQPVFGLSGFPSLGQLTNWDFIRMTALASNIYDQYYLSTSGSSTCPYNAYDQPDVAPWNAEFGVNGYGGYTLAPIPQFSTGSVSSTGNPTNAVVINAGPITTVTTGNFDYGTCIAVQLLFTATPEPDPTQVRYAYWWDNGNQ